jgi:thiamine pyrophosphate-dependent acetolactate synthase large subunit-like protein
MCLQPATGRKTSICGVRWEGLPLWVSERSVLVVTGDGEQLMGLGALATIGAQKPANLTIVVLDNGHFAETGMQRSHTSLGTSLSAVARGCGISNVTEIHAISEVKSLAERVNSREGCTLAQVYIRADELPRALPPRDGVYVKNRFRAALGFEPF